MHHKAPNRIQDSGCKTGRRRTDEDETDRTGRDGRDGTRRTGHGQTERTGRDGQDDRQDETDGRDEAAQPPSHTTRRVSGLPKG